MTPTAMSVAQLAARWGVTGQTIRDRIAAGQIPALRLGRTYRIMVAAVQAMEADACQAPQ